MRNWRYSSKPAKPKAPRPKRPKKSEFAPLPRNAKPDSERPAPAQFPILDGIGAPRRYFPGELLDNARCIEVHGRGLANMAERGGMGPWEIAGNLKGLGWDECHRLTKEEAERIMSEAIVEWWRGAKS